MSGSNCVLKSKLCSSKTGTNLTFTTCSTFNTSCSVNLAGTACVDIQSVCTGYSDLPSCRKSTAGLCKIETTCKAIDNPVVCANIVKNGTPVLTYEIC